MRSTAVSLALLTACAPFNPTSADQRAIDTAAQAWRASGLPVVAGCLDHIKAIKRYPDYAAFKKECQNPFSTREDPRVFTGCTTSGFSPVPWRGAEYVIHIPPGNPHEYTTIQHETLHVLILCAALHPNADALHTDKRIWKSGGPDSVEKRANEVR